MKSPKHLARRRGRGERLDPAARGRLRDALHEDANRSDLCIAKTVGVSDKTVAKARRLLEETGEITERAKTIGYDEDGRLLVLQIRNDRAVPDVQVTLKIEFDVMHNGRRERPALTAQSPFDDAIRSRGSPGLVEAVRAVALDLITQPDTLRLWTIRGKPRS